MKERKINIGVVGVVYFVIFSIAVAIHHAHPLFRFPKLNDRFLQVVLLDMGIGLLAGLCVVTLSALAIRLSTAFRELSSELLGQIGPIGLQDAFFLSAFSAAGEEFLFRGILQGEFGLVTASVIFGLFHIGPGKKFLPWTVFALVVGFALGGLYAWRDDLVAPLMMHFTINFINLLFLARWIAARGEKEKES